MFRRPREPLALHRVNRLQGPALMLPLKTPPGDVVLREIGDVDRIKLLAVRQRLAGIWRRLAVLVRTWSEELARLAGDGLVSGGRAGLFQDDDLFAADGV